MTERERRLLETIKLNGQLFELYGNLVMMLSKELKVTDDTIQLRETANNMKARAKAIEDFHRSFEDKPVRSTLLLNKFQ